MLKKKKKLETKIQRRRKDAKLGRVRTKREEENKKEFERERVSEGDIRRGSTEKLRDRGRKYREI